MNYILGLEKENCCIKGVELSPLKDVPSRIQKYKDELYVGDTFETYDGRKGMILYPRTHYLTFNGNEATHWVE